MSELTNADVKAATHNDPASALETAERRAAVVESMDKMPDDERTILEWKCLNGLSVRETAASPGRTEKAVEQTLTQQELRCLRPPCRLSGRTGQGWYPRS